jgi:hypothetical protein
MCKMKKLICIINVTVFLSFGIWGLDHTAKQQRDIARKHDLEDIETALFRYAKAHGTYPPNNELVWCGILSDPKNNDIRSVIDTALREGPSYEDPEKPFPSDPVYGGTSRDYAYWKTNPVSFELVATLESDTKGARSIPCIDDTVYHYRIESTTRKGF